MILCERCGRFIPSSEVFFRVEVAGRRRMFCGDCGKAAIEEQKAATAGEAKPAAKAPPKVAPKVAPKAAAGAGAGAAAGAAKPKLSPEELEARKKAALEKAAAAKAAKAAKPGGEGAEPGS